MEQSVLCLVHETLELHWFWILAELILQEGVPGSESQTPLADPLCLKIHKLPK